MILHLIPDEKFADYVIHQFLDSNMKSRLILVTNGIDVPVAKEYMQVQVVVPNSEEFKNLLLTLTQYSAVVFHGLFWPWQEQIIKIIPTQVKVAWMFWGGEIYGQKDLQTNFLSHSSRLLLRWRNLKHFFWGNGGRNIEYSVPIECFMRIDYCLTDIPMECEFASLYLHHPMRMLWYNYYSIEETLGEGLLSERCVGNGIFIGNSATIENNHLDVFVKLATLPIREHKLVVPLSYGAPWYRNFINKVGHSLFGMQFYPLLDFMERSEYNRTMLSCNTMVMPHFRAQAQGNIITGLWLGMRVYLYERNVAYQYFKKLGVKIYSIDKDLNKHNPYLFAPMEEVDIVCNRAILLRIYGRKAIENAAKNIVDTLNV